MKTDFVSKISNSSELDQVSGKMSSVRFPVLDAANSEFVEPRTMSWRQNSKIGFILALKPRKSNFVFENLVQKVCVAVRTVVLVTQ